VLLTIFDLALRMQVSCWIMYGIALAILCMRLLAKLRISARLAIDDGLMVLSMVRNNIPDAFHTNLMKWYRFAGSYTLVLPLLV